MLNNLSKIFQSPAKKDTDDIKIHTYNTLINFYIQNGYQTEALSTLEELAQHYYDSGCNADATKVLQLITRMNPTYDTSKLKAARFNKNNYPDEQKQKQPDRKLTDNNNNPKPRQAEVRQSVAMQGSSDFFDLENALNDDNSSALNSIKSSCKTPVSPPEKKLLQFSHEEIFKEMKNGGENNTNKNSPDFHYNLGIAHQQLCQSEEAIEEFIMTLSYLKKYQERNISSVINSSDCYVSLAKCYIALNKPSKADEYVRKGEVLDSLTKDEQIYLKKFTSVPLNTDAKKNRFCSIEGYVSPIKNALCRLRKFKTTRRF